MENSISERLYINRAYFRFLKQEQNMNIIPMKTTLLFIGKTRLTYLQEGISDFEKRIQKHIPFTIHILPEIKKYNKLPVEQQKKKEGEQIIEAIPQDAYVVLLDSRGKQKNSREFSQFLQTFFNSGTKYLYFVIGGPHGFSNEVYKRSQLLLSLSAMTFPHELTRLIALEQIYRALNIIEGTSYHNA